MMKPRVADVLLSEGEVSSLVIMGWVRTKRESKDFVFLEINDGSCLKNLQAIITTDAAGFDLLERVNTGAAVRLEGALVESPGRGRNGNSRPVAWISWAKRTRASASEETAHG